MQTDTTVEVGEVKIHMSLMEHERDSLEVNASCVLLPDFMAGSSICAEPTVTGTICLYTLENNAVPQTPKATSSRKMEPLLCRQHNDRLRESGISR
jgi:hypothetical protein